MNKILISEQEIHGRIRSLAAEIEGDYPKGEEIHLVAVLKGGFMFLADLVRAMSTGVTMDFMAQVQAYVMTHQYESLLKKANFKGGGLGPVR